MQVDEMSDREKSVMLAKAMGWAVGKFSGHTPLFGLPSDYGVGVIDWYDDFYDPANMALAWRVHLWAIGGNDIWQEYNHFCKENLTHNSMIAPFWCFPDAQRLWLDKVLELLIEAGLVELCEEK